jgi:hypothetical protein
VAGVRTLVCCVLAATAGLVPTPIGKGPRFRPPPRTERFACEPAPIRAGRRVHLEVFAKHLGVVVPDALGLAAPVLRLGRVVSAGCRARAWTLDRSGVIRFEPAEAGRPVTLADVFELWGQPLGRRRLASFSGPVSLWVNGTLRAGDPRTLRLRDRDEIVLEIGGFVPPHRSFRFPP